MKKFIQEIFNKWFIGIAVAFLMMFGSASIDYFNRFYSLPEKVKEIHEQRKKDSIFSSQFIYRIEKLERRNILDSIYLNEDDANIRQIKTKLKLK